MGEKWEYTSTTQIDSREPKKSDGFPNKMTGISISNFPYYFNFFFFSINYFSILMQN